MSERGEKSPDLPTGKKKIEKAKMFPDWATKFAKNISEVLLIHSSDKWLEKNVENHSSRVFAKEIIDLIGPEFNPVECLRWVNNSIEEFNQSVREKKLYEDFNCDCPEVRFTLTYAYLFHWGQKRRTGASYTEHLTSSVENRLKFLKEEKEVFGGVIISAKEMINGIIKDVLHDGLEDVFDNLGNNILAYRHKQGDEIPETMEMHEEIKRKKQKLFAEEIIKHFKINFKDDESITHSLVSVFTKFSKRLLVTSSNGYKMTKEDKGIIDFIVRNMSIQKVEDLLLILSEKLHNLETIEKMADSKMIEFYNLAISLMAAGLRTPAKKLLRKFFSYYLHKRGKKTETGFLNILTEKRATDEIYFKSFQVDLEKDLDKLYGKDGYTIENRPFDDWRVHEIAMMEYHKLSNTNYPANSKDDKLAYYFISKQILNDPKFKDILSKVPSSRVLITVKADAGGDNAFHRRRNDLGFKYFDIMKGSKIDYYGEQKAGEDSARLRLSDYKGICFAIKPKEGDNNVAKFLKDRNIQCKLVTQQDFDRNEYGKFFVSSDGTMERSSLAISNFLNFIKESIIGKENYRLLDRIVKEPLGIDLNTQISKIEMPDEDAREGFSDNLKEKTVLDVLLEITEKLRKENRLYPWIEVGRF